MSIVRNIIVGVAGTGLAAGVAAGLGGFDNTTRDDNGQITESGGISVFNLQVGDCLNDSDLESTEGVVSDSLGVPCTESHQLEVFAERLITDLTDYSETAINEEAESFCLTAFDSYIGIDYQSSSLDFTYLVPTIESWENGDNEITCIAVAPQGQTLNQSVRNSAL
jgi:hypothetical protein